MANVCPQCGKDDRIQKVSAIYSAGLTHISLSGPSGAVAMSAGSEELTVVGSYTTLHGTAQSALISKLSPPERPSKPLSLAWLWVVGGILGYLFWCLVPGPCCAGTPLLLGLLGHEGIASSPMSSGLIILLAAILMIIGIGITSALVVKGIRRDRLSQQNYQKAIEEWINAVNVWNRLYYCARDDCVFDPITGISVSVDRMEELLYQ